MSKYRGFYSFLLICLLIQSSMQQSSQDRSKCMSQKTCGDCMEAGPHCGWCRQEDYENLERCDVVDELLKNQCDSNMLENRLSNLFNVENKSPRSGDGNSISAIQLQPQRSKIILRPNQPFTFPVHFRLAENYPVDLYFILDLSQSMDDDKKKLAELGSLLAKQMTNITQDFRLGFGSFVDKKTMPYVSTVPAMLEHPCEGCESPYAFKNQLSLTDHVDQFKTKLDAAPISGNLDSPEGGFDAIMQAITCKKEINWREKSRKMVLFSTDAGFHYAGDGKLGGIITPNDGRCHLVNNEYVEEFSLTQDYPSISQLAHKISDAKVNVIFAVTSDQINVYKNLSVFIEGSVVGKLAKDSANIVDLVQDNYDKISGSVEMKVENNDDIAVQFKSKCLGQEYRETNECGDIKVGKNVTFDVTMTAFKCPSNKDNWKKNITITTIGLDESLVVEVELVCGCGCESTKVGNSDKCNGKGTRVCGSCECGSGSYGNTCECDSSTVVSGDYDSSCKKDDDSPICSGHGQCICGKCQCDFISPSDPSKKYSGNFCDCNDYNCDYFEGKQCGGPEMGRCECGECLCTAGYGGGDCGCAKSNETCKASDGSYCNNRGVCHCGRCLCTELNYKGRTCEECPTCPTDCDERRNCVLCGAFNDFSGIDDVMCNKTCANVAIVPSFDLLDNSTGMVWNSCRFRDDKDGCDVLFRWEASSLEIKVLQEKVCPEPVNLWFVLMFLIFGIILIGLLLLILWKILITIHDRREYARFEKEREMAKWDTAQNPIYKQATSTYKNPTYNKVN